MLNQLSSSRGSLSRLVAILAGAALIFLLGGCSSNDQKAETGSEQSLYNNAQRYLKSGDWDAAVKTLQLMEEHFPFGSYAEQAQLELIYAQFRTAEHEAAIAAAERFIRLHPQHRNVDYAYYMRGVASFYNETAITTALITDISNRDTGSAKDSFNYFAQLLTKFPDSAYALDAQRRMVFLRNTLARYEIHAANYYFKRGAFVAAANRGRYVVENMQGTPAVPDGLAVMAQAYHLLGMQNLADDAARVLAANFPQHPSIDKDGGFIYQAHVNTQRSWLSYLTLGLLSKRQFVNFDSRAIFNAQFSENPNLTAPPSRS